jgi:hypothetical protein
MWLGRGFARAFHKDDEPTFAKLIGRRYAKNCVETDRHLACFETRKLQPYHTAASST